MFNKKLNEAVFGIEGHFRSYMIGGWEPKVPGLVDKVTNLQYELKIIERENLKLKAIVAELVDYVYRDKK